MKQYLLQIEYAGLIYEKRFKLSQEYTKNGLIELVKSSFIADYIDDLCEYTGDWTAVINADTPISIDLYEKQENKSYDLLWSTSFQSFDALCNFVDKISVDEHMTERIKKAKKFISKNYYSIEDAIESDDYSTFYVAIISSLIGNSIIRFIDNYDAIYRAYEVLRDDEFLQMSCDDYINRLEWAFK